MLFCSLVPGTTIFNFAASRQKLNDGDTPGYETSSFIFNTIFNHMHTLLSIMSRFSLFYSISFFLSSANTPGMELVHCSKTELASHFSSETALQQTFEQYIKPTLSV